MTGISARATISPYADFEMIHKNEFMTINTFIKARDLAKKLAVEKKQQRLLFSKKFIAGLISEYHPTGSTSSPVVASKHPLAKEMGNIAKELDVEMAGYLIGSTYSVMLPDEYRGKYGVFYTPPSLTSRLLDQAEKQHIDWATAKIIDPACGGGAFLSPVAMRMSKSLKSLTSAQRIKHIENHLSGFELDAFSAWMSQVFVEIVLSDDLKNLRRPMKDLVTVCDSMHVSDSHYGTYDLVVGNPPYGKVKLNKEDRDKWHRGLYGHANLYGIFAELATRLAAEDGVIAYVTPTSFLGGQYFQALRNLLAVETPPAAFDFIASRDGVFANVLQEALLSIYRKRPGRRLVAVSYLSVQESGDLKVTTNGRYYLPENTQSPWIFPRSKEQSVIARAAQQSPYRLSDLGYTVSTGPLVWNRHKTKLHHEQVSGSIPLIWAECVDGNATGKFTFRATLRNHAPWFKPGAKDDANIVSEPCVLLQRTTSLEQPRRLIAAELPQSFLSKHGGKVTVENHLNMIKPRKGCNPIISASTIAALLNSHAIDQVFRCINGSTAVSAYELEAMPIPSPNEIKKLQSLLSRGAQQQTIEKAIMDMYLNVCEIAAA